MKKRILVVDDSVFVWEEIKQFLVNSEFEPVAFAKSGEEAIKLYSEIKPDIVTMDIILPGIDGIETSKHILNEWPDAKIVIVSSLAYEETIEQAKDIGTYGFIYKPFEDFEILNVLRTAAIDSK